MLYDIKFQIKDFVVECAAFHSLTTGKFTNDTSIKIPNSFKFTLNWHLGNNEFRLVGRELGKE